MKIFVAVIVVLIFSSIAAAQYFFPLRLIRQQAFVGFSGEVVPRYQFRFFRDAGTGTCVLVLTDETTGHFSITAVSSDSCTMQ